MAEALGLTRVSVHPCGRAAHKTHHEMAPNEVRCEMIRLAVRDHPVMEVSDIEGRRPGRSYSIETLRQIRGEVGPGCELYFILGLDAILEIPTWKDYAELFNLCHFVVLDRPGYERRRLEEVLTREVHPGFLPLQDEAGFRHPSGYQVIFLGTTLLDISATGIRRLVRQGRSIRYLLPEAVRGYIINHKLYL